MTSERKRAARRLDAVALEEMWALVDELGDLSVQLTRAAERLKQTTDTAAPDALGADMEGEPDA